MRIAASTGGLIALFAAMPVAARDAPVATRDALTSLMPLPIALRAMRMAPDLRLRFGLGAAPQQPDTLMTRLQPRFVTAMIDYYPVDGRGFHVSAGSRLFARRNFAVEAEVATRGLIHLPRGGGGALRSGIRRFAPAMTLGYTGDLATGMTLGLEAGARMGRSFTALPRLRGRDGGAPDAGAPNPLVTMVFGLRF